MAAVWHFARGIQCGLLFGSYTLRLVPAAADKSIASTMRVRAKTELRGPRPVRPGTQKPQRAEIDAMIRVDHAGEFGALRIYEGQLAVLAQHPGAGENVR